MACLISDRRASRAPSPGDTRCSLRQVNNAAGCSLRVAWGDYPRALEQLAGHRCLGTRRTDCVRIGPSPEAHASTSGARNNPRQKRTTGKAVHTRCPRWSPGRPTNGTPARARYSGVTADAISADAAVGAANVLHVTALRKCPGRLTVGSHPPGRYSREGRRRLSQQRPFGSVPPRA